MLTLTPNECNSTLTSITGGTYPYPDTYIYIKMFFGGLESRQSMQFAHGGYPHLHSFINLVPRVVLEQPWLSQAISSILIGRQFFKLNV